MGNGALPHGLSYRAHPRTSPKSPAGIASAGPLTEALRKFGVGFDHSGPPFMARTRPRRISSPDRVTGRSGPQPVLPGGRGTTRSSAERSGGYRVCCGGCGVAGYFRDGFLSLFYSTGYIGHQLFQIVLGGLKPRRLCVHSQSPFAPSSNGKGSPRSIQGRSGQFLKTLWCKSSAKVLSAAVLGSGSRTKVAEL